MLQQTRVQTVIDYYERFLRDFSNVRALAEADFDRVLKAWEGLGYYRRAKHLHQAAKRIVDNFNAELPSELEELQNLPGFGFYTASAVASIAFHVKTVPVDGNIVRVIARLFGIATDGASMVEKRGIQRYAERLLPEIPDDIPHLVQSLMELGALVCLPDNPDCDICPVRVYCKAKKAGAQSRYPIRRKRDKLPVVHRDIAMIRKDGKILMVKRADDGLLASMWEFPETSAVLARTKRNRFHATHTFTHLKWDLDVFECTVGEIPEGIEWKWFTPEEVEALALPVVFRRIWNRWMSE